MIFISYRISDSLDLVGRLDDSLTRAFGAEHVFRDKTRLQAGKDWTTQLEENAKTRLVMLVVIGLTWHTVKVPDGELKDFPRLYDEDDWVRREITLALKARKIILPLFLTGATMPEKKWLKGCGLARLHSKQGLPLQSTNYDTDLAKLIAELRVHCPKLPERSPLVPTVPPSRPPKEKRPRVVSTLKATTHDGRDPRMHDPEGAAFDKTTRKSWIVDELETEKLEAFLSMKGTVSCLPRNRAPYLSRTDKLECLGLMRDKLLTTGAVLCFATPSKLVGEFGASQLQMTIYSTTKGAVSSRNEITPHFGNLLTLYDEAMSWVINKLPKNGRVGSTQRDDSEIPQEALREAIANALVHRDYEHQTYRDQPTRIDLYEDCLEITSYGHLPEPLTAEKLNDPTSLIVPIRRNPNIALVFQCMSHVELNATGISRMRKAMLDAELPAPLIDTSQQGTVVVRLTRPLMRGRGSEGSRERPTPPELDGTSPPPQSSAKVWRPGVIYPLQPAPHFSGRKELLKDLTAWAVAADDPNRVVALVAAGGTGKTAIAERVLASLNIHTVAGVFVWSFYEDPKTEAFLRAACEYFFGEAPKETGGLLERLQLGLRTNNLPHLLILDGLELVQATGTTGRPRGELENPLLKRFLRWLAAGLGTRAKALITSRFPLPDLADWKGHGFRPIDLADIDPLAARAILRRWGVRGTDAALNALSGSVHQHALTVDVLGSYLGTFHSGDPTQAPSFDPQFLADTDPKTARLHRVLTSYAEKLPPRERDLLARLSVFPRGVGVDVIGYMIDAGGDVAGTLVGCGQFELLKLLERLQELGLVFRYDAGGAPAFTAHPFLRGFFEKLLGVNDPKKIHEAVRAKLAAGLEERPEKSPTDLAELDRYERLIEVTRLAGDTQQAFDLYAFGLGNFEHLGKVLGDNARGLRVLVGFSADGTPAAASLTLSDRERGLLVNDWGLFAVNLGDLSTARQIYSIITNNIFTSNRSVVDIGLRNNVDVESLAGRWPLAREAASTSVRHAELTHEDSELRPSYARFAMAMAQLGLYTEARHHFSKATECQSEPMLYANLGVWEAEWKLATGDRRGALIQTEANQKICRRLRWTRDLALCEIVFGLCALPDDPEQARTHLNAAREYASRTGNIEVTLRCYHLTAEIARHERKLDVALSEALDGIQLADSCGFGRWSLDIRTELAKIHLAAGELAKAIEPAEWVLKQSEKSECQYAWGVADSLHLLGVAHARMRGKANKAKARDYLQRAVEKRRAIEHGELKESEDELQMLQ